MPNEKRRIFIEIRDENFTVIETFQVNDIEWYNDRIKPEVDNYEDYRDDEGNIR